LSVALSSYLILLVNAPFAMVYRSCLTPLSPFRLDPSSPNFSYSIEKGCCFMA
jgi:hypothetical protein